MGGIDRTKNWPRVIMHVDMDAFFAAVETRNVPHLKGKPVIVGGDARYRSVVSTCSYEARKYGVHSGMPIARARKLCPQGIYISGNHRGYVHDAAVLINIFEKYTSIVEPFSIDEAMMDITGCHRIFGTVENLVRMLKEEINKRLSLTCSVGIAPTRMIAKMASSENKPDGMTIMDRDDFKREYYPRPVDALWGIGEKTRIVLNNMGIYTIADLVKRRESKKEIFPIETEGELASLSRSLESTSVYSINNLPREKSMSHETTLIADLRDIDKIYSTLLWLSDKVSRRLRRGNYVGRTVSVKIRSADFSTITRDRTLASPTDQCKIIFENAKKLIPVNYGLKTSVRLLGVRVSHLKNNKEFTQLSLFSSGKIDKLQSTSRAVDEIRKRFGSSIITFAGSRI